MEEISKLADDELRNRILSKDENLLKRGEYIKQTGSGQKQIIIDGDSKNTQQSIVDAIFGNNLRKDGERTVERIITISIRDNVID
jgi:NAD(P)H-hydrate repair Nnr-like enzyme with NAD(P)H-hydrate epimerase domain